MDEFRVTSTSPYAQNSERPHPDGGKRRKHPLAGIAPSGEDEVVLSGIADVQEQEESVGTYTPGPRTQD